MTKVKDGFWKQLGSKVGSNDYLLKAAGGYIGVGNSAGEVVPINNSTRNTGLNADMVDGYHFSDLEDRYVNVSGDWMNTDAFLYWKGSGNSTSAYTIMGYKDSSGGGNNRMHLGSDTYNTKGFYIASNGYNAGNDWGGLVIDNDGVSIFGAGDTGSVFRVLNEDNVADGAQFIVTKNAGGAVKYRFSIGQNTVNTSYNLYVNGTSYLNGWCLFSNTTIIIPVVSYTKLIESYGLRSDYTSAGYPTEEFLKAWCKYAYEQGAGYVVHSYISPSSRGYIVADIYASGLVTQAQVDGGGTYATATVGLPIHITGRYYPHGGSEIIFGTSYGTWYYRKGLDSSNYTGYLGYIGTTAVQASSYNQALTGITSITGPGGSINLAGNFHLDATGNWETYINYYTGKNIYMCAGTNKGKVGIRTTSPREAFDVYGASAVFGGNGVQYPIQITRAYNDSVNFLIGSAAAGSLNMRISNNSSAGNGEVYIDLISGGTGISANPKLGVNTSTLTYTFNVAGKSYFTQDVRMAGGYPFYVRDSAQGWNMGIFGEMSGNDCMTFVADNAVTSFMFCQGQGNLSGWTSGKFNSVTPAMQIKNNSVYINKLLANGVSPSYKLYVEGTSYINDTLSAKRIIINDANVGSASLTVGGCIRITGGPTTSNMNAGLRRIFFGDSTNACLGEGGDGADTDWMYIRGYHKILLETNNGSTTIDINGYPNSPGFIKTGYDNTYVLTAGGGAKLESNLNVLSLRDKLIFACSCYATNTYSAYKITTTWPKTDNCMPTINIRGYAYGTSKTIDCDIVIYHYDNTPCNYSLTNKGSYPIKVYSKIENDVQVFYFNPGEYYGMFNVFVYGGMGVNLSRFSGWTMETVSAVDGNEIPQNSIATSITGSSSNSDKLDGYDSTQFLAWEAMKSGWSGAPFQSAVDYFNNLNNLNNGAKILYSHYGAEYTMLFTRRNDAAAHGSILKWGYSDNYIRMIRMISGSPQTSDWEKISAGYADSAGNADTVDNYHFSDLEDRYVNVTGDWMNWNAQIYFKGLNESTSVYSKIGYATSASGQTMHCISNGGYQANGAFYITTNGSTSANDTAGLAIDNEGVTVFGAGDAGSNFTGVFRVLNEDNVADGPQFLVTKNTGAYFKYNLSIGQQSVNTSYRLYVNGGLERIDNSSRYLILGTQNSSHAHYETNADVSHWFNKRIDVNGAIWRYGTNYGIADDGQFYAKAIYANRDGAGTYGGVSLYSTSDPITEYGIAFRGTGSYGKLGRVQGDWATYFTMDSSYNRGWIFRSGGTNYASISARGEAYFSAVGTDNYIAYPSGGFFSSNGSTGYIIITIPANYRSCTMMRFNVEIYNYLTGTSTTYTIGGYNYDDGNWYNVFAYANRQGTTGFGNLTVRFGHNGTNSIIWIGESNTSYSYPKVRITNVTLGHSTTDYNTWSSGWSVTIATTAPTNVSQTVTNPATNYYAQSVPWSGITGKPTSKTIWGQTYINSSGEPLTIAATQDLYVNIIRDENGNYNYGSDGSGNLSIGTTASNHTISLRSTTSGTELYLNSSGNIGIGTTSPTTKLDIRGGSILVDAFTTGNEAGIFFRNGFTASNKYNVSILAYDHIGDTTTPDGLSINGYDGISFCTGSNNRNEVVRITGGTSPGNVGIGTTSPSYKLTVSGSIFGDSITMGEASGYFRYRTASSLESGFYFHSSGRESVVFANEYAHTGWIFVNGIKPSNRTQWNALGVTPALQIHHNAIYVNRIVRDADTSDYNLYVGGTVYTTDRYCFPQGGSTYSWNRINEGYNRTSIRAYSTAGQSATGAPDNYSIGIMIDGYYSFALAGKDGGAKLVWRNNSGTWYDIITSQNIGSQSVNYANSAGSASSSTYARYLTCPDTRSSAPAPGDYTATSTGVSFDFKQSSVTGLSGYSGVMTVRPYASGQDWSGGEAHQIAFLAGGGLYHRIGTSSWGSWERILTSSNWSSYITTSSADDTVWQDSSNSTKYKIQVVSSLPSSTNSNTFYVIV